MAENSSVAPNRNERVVSYMIVSAFGLSIVTLLINIATGASGIDKSQGIWPVVVVLPLIGLPIAFILIIVLLVLTATRRARSARDAVK